MTAVAEPAVGHLSAYEAHVAAVVAQAPPLTPHQVSRLTVLLRAGDDAATELPRQRRAA